MDKKTFKALDAIVEQLEEQVGSPHEKEIDRVLNWMDDVREDYEGPAPIEKISLHKMLLDLAGDCSCITVANGKDNFDKEIDEVIRVHYNRFAAILNAVGPLPNL